MQNLQKFFPLVAAIFAANGVSQSEAQRRQADNANEVAEILKTLSGKHYDVKTTAYSNAGTNITTSEMTKEISPDNFNDVPRIAELHRQNAIYGFAIKYKAALPAMIRALSSDLIAIMFDIEEEKVEVPTRPVKVEVTKTNIDTYCELNKAEQLFEQARPELCRMILEKYQEVMMKESEAAVYGKQIHPDGWLRKLMNAEPVKEMRGSSNDSVILERELILHYDKDDFRETVKELTEKYNSKQMERNGVFVWIKNTARELQRSYDERHAKLLAEYQTRCRARDNAHDTWRAEIEAVKTALLQEVAALKVKTP